MTTIDGLAAVEPAVHVGFVAAGRHHLEVRPLQMTEELAARGTLAQVVDGRRHVRSRPVARPCPAE